MVILIIKEWTVCDIKISRLPNYCFVLYVYLSLHPERPLMSFGHIR